MIAYFIFGRVEVEAANRERKMGQLHMEQLLLQKKAKADGYENLTCVLQNRLASISLCTIHFIVRIDVILQLVTIVMHLILQACSLRHGMGQ